MEENRLTPMPDNYDVKLFNRIYKETDGLRRKLAYGIDARRFGVDYKEILSWFDVKFIHAFNRYQNQHNPDVLKGHIITSLQFFRNRILRFSYSQKAQIHNTIDLDQTFNCKEIEVGIGYDETQTLLSLAMSTLKTHLSREAYRVLQIEMDPPLYIIDKLSEKNNTRKIPSNLIADYLGWGTETEGVRKVNLCRKEIKSSVDEVRQYFSQVEI